MEARQWQLICHAINTLPSHRQLRWRRTARESWKCKLKMMISTYKSWRQVDEHIGLKVISNESVTPLAQFFSYITSLHWKHCNMLRYKLIKIVIPYSNTLLPNTGLLCIKYTAINSRCSRVSCYLSTVLLQVEW